MSIEEAVDERLEPIESDLEAVKGVSAGNAGHIQQLAHDLTALGNKVKALEEGKPPVDDDPVVVKPPVGNPGIIGMNSGFPGRHDNPDDPSLPGYAEKLAPVCGCYRPMSWSRINDDTTAYNSIDDVHKYLGVTWRGLFTRQVALANSVGADFYWNAPVAATAGFYRKAVAFIRSQLSVGRKLYVAWGNELWNGGMGTYKWLVEAGGESPGSLPNGYFDLWSKRMELFFVAARDGDPNCIRVAETKTAKDGRWYSHQIIEGMSDPDAWDALAGTLYFNPHYSGYWSGMSVDQLLDACEREWEGDDKQWQDKNLEWAKERGKLYLAYEGGQHYHKYGFESLTRQAQSHPRTIEMYRRVYGNAISKGIDLIVDFDFLDWDNEHGHWGKASSLSGLDSSAKYQVLKEIAGGH